MDRVLIVKDVTMHGSIVIMNVAVPAGMAGFVGKVALIVTV